MPNCCDGKPERKWSRRLLACWTRDFALENKRKGHVLVMVERKKWKGLATIPWENFRGAYIPLDFKHANQQIVSCKVSVNKASAVVEDHCFCIVKSKLGFLKFTWYNIPLLIFLEILISRTVLYIILQHIHFCH